MGSFPETHNEPKFHCCYRRMINQGSGRKTTSNGKANWTLKMTLSAQVVKTSDTVNNSPIQEYARPDDHNHATYS